MHVQGKGSTADQGSSNYTQCSSFFYSDKSGNKTSTGTGSLHGVIKSFQSSATATKTVM